MRHWGNHHLIKTEPIHQLGDLCLLYAATSEITGEQLWQIKPKMHLFIEMAEFQTESSGDPSLFWAYADESFVGLIGQMAMSRGGKRMVTTVPVDVIGKYRGSAAPA